MPDWHELVGKDVHLYMVGAVDFRRDTALCITRWIRRLVQDQPMTENVSLPESYLQHFLGLSI